MTTPRWDVVGVGANSVDAVHRLPALPERRGDRSKMRVTRRTMSCGGQMATAMTACAAFGLRVKYVGVTGADENGYRVRREMAARDVDMADAIIRDAPNQFALIIVDENTGERIVLWDRDDRLALRERELPVDAIAAARLVHVDDTDEDAAIRAATLARTAGIPCTSDLDRITGRTGALVAAVSIPIFAEHVPAALTGEADPERALRRLRTRHQGLLVVTLGEHGALALEGDRLHHSPGCRITPVDTTGAGDVFRGGFIYGLLEGWPVDRVLRFANAAAAVSCTRLGALDSVPSLDDVMRLLDAGAAER